VQKRIQPPRQSLLAWYHYGVRITVVGAGYVGLSNAALLAGRHDVTLLEIAPVKVEAINQRRCPIIDEKLQDCLAHDELRLQATNDSAKAYRGSAR